METVYWETVPVEVDDEGKVISAGEGNGYIDPVDRDSNFIPDYLDFGSSVSIIVEPEDIYIVESLDSLVQVITEVTESETMVLYTWQVSENNGITWEGLSNTSSILEIINADVSYNERLFRVIVSHSIVHMWWRGYLRPIQDNDTK